MSVLSLDASQSVKLTLMKDVSYCLVRSDKLGRRRDVLVVFNDRRMRKYFSGRTREEFQQELSSRGIAFRRECPPATN